MSWCWAASVTCTCWWVCESGECAVLVEQVNVRVCLDRASVEWAKFIDCASVELCEFVQGASVELSRVTYKCASVLIEQVLTVPVVRCANSAMGVRVDCAR